MTTNNHDVFIIHHATNAQTRPIHIYAPAFEAYSQYRIIDKALRQTMLGSKNTDAIKRIFEPVRSQAWTAFINTLSLYQIDALYPPTPTNTEHGSIQGDD